MLSLFAYHYFVGVLVMLAIWSCLVLIRRDLFRVTLVTSTVFGILGTFGALFYNHDWWRPATITGTYVGIEDFLFAFSLSGISFATAHVLLRTKPAKSAPLSWMMLGMAVGVSIGSYALLALVMLAGLTSFWSATVVGVLLITGLLWLRRDAGRVALVSAIAVPVLLLPAYLIPEALSPGWFASEWTLRNLSGMYVLGIPIEDLVWISLSATVVSLLVPWLLQPTARTAK